MIDATIEVAALLALKHPTRPGQKLPLPLRRLIPQPTQSLEDFQRSIHEDIPSMSTAARRAEAFRWRVALTQVEAEVVPDYVIERIARLEAA